MQGSAILVAANRTLRMIARVLDPLNNFGFVRLVVLGKLSHAL
jgi:hypothetical protein